MEKKQPEIFNKNTNLFLELASEDRRIFLMYYLLFFKEKKTNLLCKKNFIAIDVTQNSKAEKNN
jgi:hypothetical protein